MQDKATKLEWLEWFYQQADFGPAHGDVMAYYKEEFMRRTGKSLPDGYQIEEDE